MDRLDPAIFAGKSTEEILEALSEFSDRECLEILYDWDGIWARDGQLIPPGDWFFWLKMTGRGYGKTRIGAEFIIEGSRNPKWRMALVAATYSDVRDIMIEGESGILECSPPSWRPKYVTSKRRLEWPNGAIATAFAGEEPERLRGPQHHRAWVEELAAWRQIKRRAKAISNLKLGLRLGQDPRGYISTTPKPIKILRELVADKRTIVTGGHTRENIANLAPTFVENVIEAYEGTTLGDQELAGKLMDESPGALWKRVWFDRDRVTALPDCDLMAVALDPNVSNKDGESEPDEAGIIWGGRQRRGRDTHYFVGGDVTTDEGPDEWPELAIECYDENDLNNLVYEKNQGGELVAKTLRTAWKESGRKQQLPIEAVHASKGKRVRAEPIVQLYKQRKVHHMPGLGDLEDQLCSWVPGEGESPGRLDALVWLITFLESGGYETAAPADMSGSSRFR